VEFTFKFGQYIIRLTLFRYEPGYSKWSRVLFGLHLVTKNNGYHFMFNKAKDTMRVSRVLARSRYTLTR
jgi:hypothetical protein